MLGAENGARTRDLNLGKVALYQLSYFRVSGSKGMTSFWLLQVFLHFFAFPFYFFLLSGRSAAGSHTTTIRRTATTLGRQPPPSDRHCPQRPLGSHLPIPYDGPAVLDINFDYAVAGDLAFEDGA